MIARPPNLASPAQRSSTTLTSPVRFFVLALVVLALLQAVLLLASGHWDKAGIGFILALATCNAAAWEVHTRYRIALLGVLATVIVINFGAYLVEAIPPYPHRLSYVSLLAAYGAVALTGLAVMVSRATLPCALICASCVALAVVAIEGLVERVSTSPLHGNVIWVEGTPPQPVVGELDRPNTTARTLYPENRRGYFDEDGLPPWHLEIHHPGSVATLDQPSDRPGVLRVSVNRADIPQAWHIQLTHSKISVMAGEPYGLSFRARADSPRQISFGVSMAHAPWDGLGFFREASIGPDWSDFSETFVLGSGDPNARLHFDLGVSSTAVELERVVLRRLPSEDVIKAPTKSTEFSVSYRFNALGCRGPDYPIPHPAARHRILAVGNSYALGVGVHESDTFAARLERSLNATSGASSESYDVINCGVSGYATREERLWYEQIGKHYEPDVVLVSMVPTDDRSWRDELSFGYAHEPRKYESLLLTTHLLRRAMDRRRPEPDYSGALKELLRLDEASRARGARLAVVIFRNDVLAPPWSDLVAAVSSGLAGTEIPFLDLGPALLRHHTVDDLRVYRGDPGPNEVAHRIAAEEIEQFLQSHGLIAAAHTESSSVAPVSPPAGAD